VRIAGSSAWVTPSAVRFFPGRLAAGGHQPQADWQADGTLDATAERIAWSRRNRHLFSGAR
jgi:hypothetical protein